MISVAAAVLLSAGVPSRLPPVERCVGDPAFAKFRSELQSSVARRDAEDLFRLMADDVRITFGGRSGKADFRDYWQRSASRRQALWRELDAVLRLGCATDVDGQGVEYRAFPAMFVTGDDLDGFTTWVSRPGAMLRAKPSSRSRSLQRLPSWTVLQADDSDGGAWIAVRTPRGRDGFIARDDARSIIDYRLIAKRRGERWMITAFIAGD
jgi:hypothetical protein